jgi:hypothetical protein
VLAEPEEAGQRLRQAVSGGGNEGVGGAVQADGALEAAVRRRLSAQVVAVGVAEGAGSRADAEVELAALEVIASHRLHVLQREEPLHLHAERVRLLALRLQLQRRRDCQPQQSSTRPETGRDDGSE